MQSDWCSAVTPSRAQTAREKTLFPSTKTAAAREFGAVAANNTESARSLADALPAAIRSNNYWKFSGSVIASNANKGVWPTNVLEGDKDEAAVVSVSERLLSDSIDVGTLVKSLTLPSDSFSAFLESTARREAMTKNYQFSSSVKELRLLPPVARNTSFEEIIGAMSKNVPLLESLESIEIAGTPVMATSSGRESADLATVLKAAKHLKKLAAKQCGAQGLTVQIANAVRDGTIEDLSLESNNLGFGNGDADLAEEARIAIGEMLKASKFLLSLNLAHNNFTSEAVVPFFDALAASDTKLTPEELAALSVGGGVGQEVPEPVPLEELIDHTLFFGDTSQNEDGESEHDAGSMEEDGEGVTSEAGAPGYDEFDGDAASSEGSAHSDEDNEDEEADEVDAGASEEETVAQGEVEGVAPSATGEELGDEEEDEEDEAELFKPDPKEMRRIARAIREVRQHEKKMRTDIQRECLAELQSVTAALGPIRACLAEERRKHIAEYCTRRSGWSRLRSFTLRGNAIGDRGTKALVSVLRSTVPRGEEDLARAEEELRTTVSLLVDALRVARHSTLTEEASAWRALVKVGGVEWKAVLRRAAAVAPAPSAQPTDAASDGDSEDDDDDEFRSDAPEVVMTNVDPVEDEGPADAARDGEGGDDAAAAEDVAEPVDEEGINWEEAAATISLPIVPTKSGMNSIVHLDLGGCGISSRGLQFLATALEDNRTLAILVLRNNRLGTAVRGKAKKRMAATAGAEEVPAGFAAFAAALTSNGTLRSLDLGYCELGPNCLRALAHGLRGHAGLHALNLEGNHFLPRDSDTAETRTASVFTTITTTTTTTTVTAAAGVPTTEFAEDAITDEEPSALLEVLTAFISAGTLKRIDLSHNAIGESLWPDELHALAGLTTATALTHLYLNGAGIDGGHVAKWAAAVEALAGDAALSLESLHLSRNRLSGEEGGQCLAQLLTHTTALRELSLDENPHLGSTGLAAALSALPAGSCLRWLSCNAVGAGAASVAVVADASEDDTSEIEAAETFVVPPPLLEGLHYLALGDLDIGEEDADHLSMWATQLQTQGNQLRCLSLWSRRLQMEESLQVLHGVVEALPTLRFVDFGVLTRFDKELDLKDRLGQIERILVARRVTFAQGKHGNG